MPYNNHFLTNVILRADFVFSEEELKHSISDKVKNLCVEMLPIFEERIINAQQLMVNGSMNFSNTIISNEKISEWHFLSGDRDKEICITNNSIYANFTKYTTYSELKEIFTSVFITLISEYPKVKINRIGLRYIDQIELPLEKKKRTNWKAYWNKYINTDLLNGLNFIVNDDDFLSRNMSSIEMNYTDYMLHFQYGIFNPDYPAANKKNLFIIDTDVYSTGLISSDEVENKIDEFHKQAKIWFENSIKDNLRKIMEEYTTNE